MSSTVNLHAIAPAQVLRGAGAWQESLPRISALCQRPLVLGRSSNTAALRDRLLADLRRGGLAPLAGELRFDCCEADLTRLAAEAAAGAGTDAVVAIGGGKVLDAGKLLAHRLGLACITVPTSAATCAGWTALANLYSPRAPFKGMWPWIAAPICWSSTMDWCVRRRPAPWPVGSPMPWPSGTKRR